MRVLRIAALQQGAVAGERDQRGELGARGIAPECNAIRIDFEILGLAAGELHRRAHVVHDLGIALLAGLG